MMFTEKRPVSSGQIDRARIPDRLAGAVLEKVPPVPRGDISEYIKDILTYRAEGTGLFLWGANGRGKSSAAVLVLKEALGYGASAFFITCEEVRIAYAKDEDKIDRIVHSDFVVLDDLGKEYRSQGGWAERALESILRRRSLYCRPTIITTNIVPEKLPGLYRPSFLSSIAESCVFVHFEGDNIRKKATLLRDRENNGS